MNALLWPNHSSITIFGLEIYWYAIIIVFGMTAAFFVISLLFRRRNMSTELFLTFKKQPAVELAYSSLTMLTRTMAKSLEDVLY